MPPRPRLPPPSPVFIEKKTRILQQLALPPTEYTDASPKGSVDIGIRHVIDKVNEADGFVTTSSCAGRVSVFLEGKRAPGCDVQGDEPQREQTAGVGGKGAGGTWLYVSHEPMGALTDGWVQALGFPDEAEAQCHSASSRDSSQRRLIHLKFEPMILQVLAASPAHAQLILTCALQAGFRESGAINLVQVQQSPIVAVRSTGLAFASLIGYETPEGSRKRLVSDDYLELLRVIVDERFAENLKRIERFHAALQHAFAGAQPKMNLDGTEWEDAAARRVRMREEGLRRKAALELKKDIDVASNACNDFDGVGAREAVCNGHVPTCNMIGSSGAL